MPDGSPCRETGAFGPAAGEAALWLYGVRVDQVPPGRLLRYAAMIDAPERDRWSSFRFERDRTLYLVAHALLRAALSRHAPVAPQDWRFAADAMGKPSIAPETGGAGLAFNLSHCGTVAACAITTAATIGIDVEDSRRRISPGLVRAATTAADRDWLDSRPEADRDASFITLWTLKEAYAKALGIGLGLPFDTVTVAPPPSLVRDGRDLSAAWSMQVMAPTDTYRLAVVGPADALPRRPATLQWILP